MSPASYLTAPPRGVPKVSAAVESEISSSLRYGGPVESDGRATDGAAGNPGLDGSRIAVIDLGTNSTRLLVADVTPDGGIQELRRETRVTRLGRGVDLSGKLSDDGIEAVCAAVADFVTAIDPLGADETVAIATSAVRDASNGDAFIAEFRERFPLSPRVIDGDTEARLTFAGATAGRPDRDSCILVADIGGGSTELIAGCDGEIEFSTSMQAGVVRQTERHVSNDPPDQAELEELADEVRSLVIDEISAHLPAQPRRRDRGRRHPDLARRDRAQLDPYDARSCMATA